jgi:electron transport complex protein RnfC
MVCINIGTTYAIKRAVIDGEPLISRVTTVTGDAVGTPRNYDTLIGTPVSHLLEHNQFNEQAGGRVVMGGPMMGFTLPSADVPVVKTTNCILAPSYAEIPDDEPAQPCIRCGMCAEACPVSLLPQQLFWYAQAEEHDRLEAHNLFDCIECGACSYVCPSNIPLVQYYRAAKGDIRQARDEKVKSDHARERFEFHKERIEQAEREKEAKRAARREATQQAKADHAAAAANGSAAPATSSASPSSSTADIIAAAQARAAAKQASPEDQRAKLERTIASAEQRLQMAEEKLAEAVNSDSGKQDKLSAAVENTRQKLEQSKSKLAELAE